MQEDFSAEAATLFLRNARLGGILTPDELRHELRHVTQIPAIGSYAVNAAVPNWLVDKLDPTKHLATEYTVYPTLDRLDTVLLATMQCANVQLRCVMQFSDPLARAFLEDALKVKMFTVLLDIEHSKQCAVMSAPMETVATESVIEKLQNAARGSAGFRPAMQLATLSCNPVFRRSLIEGQQVQDVIAVLATVPTIADIKNASSVLSREVKAGRDSNLH